VENKEIGTKVVVE